MNEYKFEEYVRQKREVRDLHPHISVINDKLHQCGHMTNVIYYGPDGVGKYSCALDYIARFSPSSLSYEKKMTVETTKGETIIKISDVHFEVDMALLGCNAKQIWNDVIKHIIDVLSLRKERRAFVMCKNFHEIHSELLDVFYSYMQTTNSQIRVYYVILTNGFSFIPNDIVNRCLKISVPRPPRNSLNAINKVDKSTDISSIYNLRDWKEGQLGEACEPLVKNIIKSITIENAELGSFDFLSLRDLIYDINVMNFNPWAVTWKLLSELVRDGKIPLEKEKEVIDETQRFLELFNNNYRPIYHLERYIYFLATIINEL